MTAPQVQTFLASKVPTCRTGYVCLKDFRQGHGGQAGGRDVQRLRRRPLRVGRRHHRKGRSVLRDQSEGPARDPAEGAGTRPAHLAERLAIHDGDGARLPRHRGVRHRLLRIPESGVWRGAAVQAYATPPGTSSYFTWFAPGNTWNVRFNPDAACGSAPVYIQNQATADLYYYRPISRTGPLWPRGYGEGDGCSAYGNRNSISTSFDWFGSTHGFEVAGTFVEYYNTQQAWLGYPVGPMTCGGVDGGCSQQFQGGYIYRAPTPLRRGSE